MCLFCNDDIFGCKYCNPNAAPPWFSAGSTAPKQHIRNVKIGLHPTGTALYLGNDGSKKCGNCIHAVAYRQSGTWYKCKLMKRTHGPGTDIKLKWWACEKWEKNT